jgi:hypothetical protein
MGECMIDFNAGEVLHLPTKKICGYTRARTNLKHIPPHVETLKYPWNNIGLYRLLPIAGTAEPAMSEVHGSKASP